MGRRKDDPLLQAAKGFPGRRKKAVEKEIEHAAEAAAAMQATPDDPFPLPELFTKAPTYWALAIKVWKEQSEVLRAAGRRRPGYRHALARYCIWTQFYVSAADQLRRDLPRGGASIKVKKGDGETVIRQHPNIDFMARCETALRLLDAEFGFTPLRDQDIVRVESFNRAQGKLPLGGTHPDQSHRSPSPGEPTEDPMDLMNGADSPPPGVRPN
ncbi:phage terminase small subunit [Rhizobium petrolearium]|uniref:P27 family phage terminase small subunit n=1 Tax=Neorhizobium petrolearium TaxID=515361 RepID=A0ABY8M271_9HYPH|nr:P27 family phage terminase small subunit [Neorhizobium petrolearium]MBP1842001.1 phage terminase small subunit [Neorhizobium petrolearium]MCC2608379.1 P27 family phage terminase small subunit [Neorhizobium petrolearium]WGI68658.1 P27 family phage terminase small subunit [Neorhizobium petrolearium]